MVNVAHGGHGDGSDELDRKGVCEEMELSNPEVSNPVMDGLKMATVD